MPPSPFSSKARKSSVASEGFIPSKKGDQPSCNAELGTRTGELNAVICPSVFRVWVAIPTGRVGTGGGSGCSKTEPFGRRWEETAKEAKVVQGRTEHPCCRKSGHGNSFFHKGTPDPFHGPSPVSTTWPHQQPGGFSSRGQCASWPRDRRIRPFPTRHCRPCQISRTWHKRGKR